MSRASTCTIHLALVVLVAAGAFGQTKIGVVDHKRIRSEFKELVAARAEAEQMFKFEQQELDDQLKRLMERVQKVQEKYRAGELSEDVYQQERSKLRMNQMELVEQRDIKQKRWDEYMESVMQPLLDRIHKAVQQIGAERGCTVVLNSKYIEYWSPEVEITDDVLAVLNRTKPAGAAR